MYWAIGLQKGRTDTGRIMADPKFANAAAGDYHLQSGSPAIGAGAAAYAPSTDLDGKPRSTTPPSIGAYEPANGTNIGGTPVTAGATPTTPATPVPDPRIPVARTRPPVSLPSPPQ